MSKINKGRKQIVKKGNNKKADFWSKCNKFYKYIQLIITVYEFINICNWLYCWLSF